MTNNTDTQGGAMTLEKGLTAFLDAMLGKNRSAATLRAYRTDVLQFIAFLRENNVAITEAGDVGKVDVLEYLAALAKKGLTGVARARKVSAIREYFRYLEGVGVIPKSPTTGIDTPKREKNTRRNTAKVTLCLLPVAPTTADAAEHIGLASVDVIGSAR